MKKIILLASILLATVSFSQRIKKGERQFNAGLFLNNTGGIPLYIGVDYGIYPDITVGGQIEFTRYSSRYNNNYGSQTQRTTSIFGGSGNANYHFNTILNIPNEWDFYAGLRLGFNSKSVYDVDGNPPRSTPIKTNIRPQIGGRYFFSENFGVNLEFSYRTYGSGAKVGGTYKF